jgi:polysaccharide pyruvyl transferase WcaK-like protein
MKVKVLVYGWYHQGNLGDDLFIDAFQYLFPLLDFVFTDHITDEHVKDADAVFFGGGSFLLDTPKISVSALEMIKQKKIFYIGVGVESHISPVHVDLMRRAQFLAIRTANQLERVRSINSSTMLIPDLVYCLKPSTSGHQTDKSVLVIPNLHVVPQHSDANWKHAAWAYFKSEFCQFLDFLVDNQFNPQVFAMCTAHKEDDRWASADLISFMRNRSNGYLLQPKVEGIKQISQLVTSHSLVITQRFHGIVLAEICKTPYIAIHHHDKLKKQPNNVGEFLSYYGLSKAQLIESFERSLSQNNTPILPIEHNIFKDLVREVSELL